MASRQVEKDRSTCLGGKNGFQASENEELGSEEPTKNPLSTKSAKGDASTFRLRLIHHLARPLHFIGEASDEQFVHNPFPCVCCLRVLSHFAEAARNGKHRVHGPGIGQKRLLPISKFISLSSQKHISSLISLLYIPCI